MIVELDQVDWIMERLDRAIASARRLRPVVKIKKKVEKLKGKFVNSV